MKDIHTDPRLLEALAAAARQRLGGRQMLTQKVSFVMGSLDEGSPITRAQVEKSLREHADEAA